MIYCRSAEILQNWCFSN